MREKALTFQLAYWLYSNFRSLYNIWNVVETTGPFEKDKESAQYKHRYPRVIGSSCKYIQSTVIKNSINFQLKWLHAAVWSPDSGPYKVRNFQRDNSKMDICQFLPVCQGFYLVLVWSFYFFCSLIGISKGSNIIVLYYAFHDAISQKSTKVRQSDQISRDILSKRICLFRKSAN